MHETLRDCLVRVLGEPHLDEQGNPTGKTNAEAVISVMQALGVDATEIASFADSVGVECGAALVGEG